jgi:hypothetical protein
MCLPEWGIVPRQESFERFFSGLLAMKHRRPEQSWCLEESLCSLKVIGSPR